MQRYLGFMNGGLSGFYFSQGMSGYGIALFVLGVILLFSWYRDINKLDNTTSV